MSNSNSNLQPLITVVIPTYNRLPFLQQAVESVIAQTYTNWELIIVDDGSTDGTKEAVQLLQDKRIHVFSVPHCANISVLRNAGVAAGIGAWVAFLDSDDMWLPEKLEVQIKALQQKKMQCCYGGFELMNEAGQTIPNKTGDYIPCSGSITKELLTNKAAVNIGSLILTRKLFDELNGFDCNPKLVLREDYEFVLRLSAKVPVLAVADLMVRVREHPGRSTNNINDGFKRTAFLYRHFANNCPDKSLKKIARQRQAHHETEIAVNKIQQKKYGEAIVQFAKAYFMGDKLRHLLSAFRRSIIANKEIFSN